MIALDSFGSFFVGGRDVVVTGQAPRTVAFTPTATASFDPNGHYAVEHAYVQWFRPAQVSARRPVLFVHGGGLTGATWETTPDGRPGWIELFLRRDFAVFVIDNVERGRAGWCALPGVWPDQPLARNAEWAWELFRIGPPEGFPDRPFPGQRFPVAQFAEFTKSFVPRWLSTNDAQVAALVAAIDRVGPVDLICHSHGGEIALRAAAERSGLVSSVVALEPSGQPGGLQSSQRVLTVLGDFWDANSAAKERERAMRDYAARLTAAGVNSLVWDMTARGRPGHSHMLMMDQGQEQLGQEVADWLLA